MDKRVLIFSPYIKDQEGIEFITREYFRKNFKENYEELDIQKFSDIGDSINSRNKIGMGGEVLVIFDRKLCPKEKRRKPLEWTKMEKMYFDSLRALLEISKKICDDDKIPYLMYEGEIEKREEGQLKRKIREVEEKIFFKLEKKAESLDSFI